VSNWVRVLVPLPPPPPTVPPTYVPNNDANWPYVIHSENAGPSISPNMAGIEIIAPIIIGCILLLLLIAMYCYFCVIKKKRSVKSPNKSIDKLNSNITIVPSSPINHQSAPDYNDMQTVGVPVSNYGYEEEKKRYSLVHQQEQQLIEELKQQQMMQPGNPNNNYSGLSVISNNTLQRNHLSPYNSWSASQLLHEHERRVSPMDGMLQDEHIQHQDALSQLDHMSINAQYMQHIPPPVPPLPAIGSPHHNYNIYGVHQPQNQIYQQRSELSYNQTDVPYTNQINQTDLPYNNQSLQGSMSSVNSGEKKRRNVTMV